MQLGDNKFTLNNQIREEDALYTDEQESRFR